MSTYSHQHLNLFPGERGGSSEFSRNWGAIRTHSEVGRILHMSHQAVKQTERRALCKIRRAMQAFWDEYRH